MNTIDPTIFKAYDIRGIYPTQINKETAYKIGQAYAKFINPKTVALGKDVRISGPELFEAAKQGLIDHGVNVVDIGTISTDMLYFAVAQYGFDGGITISASHNPKEYNGMKMVRAKAVPISGDSGIMDIKQLVLDGYEFKAGTQGTFESKVIQKEYVEKCLSLINVKTIKPFKVVANGMFGMAMQNVFKMNLPISIVPMNAEPDGNFPKGQPDPMQEANRKETMETIMAEKPDFGVAWDADADRFFLFDENGRFVPGYYLTAFLGTYFAKKEAGAKIIYDPRQTWAIEAEVKQAGGMPIVNKAGHAFFKERMKKESAIFAGENSGHFYFRDFFNCDNGLIPFLILLEIFSASHKKVSQIFDHYFEAYPTSGEINTKIGSTEEVLPILNALEQKYNDAKIEKIDGLSIEYKDWRANIRGSNTEPLIRLNVEAKDHENLKLKTEELLALIKS